MWLRTSRLIFLIQSNYGFESILRSTMSQYLLIRMIAIATCIWIMMLFFLIRKKFRKTAIVFGVVFGLCVWIRFVEPSMIHVKYETIDLWVWKRVVVIADLHLWVYKSQNYLSRVIQKINAIEDSSMILIAWDFLNNALPRQPLDELFGPLAQVRVPWYAVMWNHDLWYPWEDRGDELTAVLQWLWGSVIDNQIIPFEDRTLVGLWSNFAGNDDVTVLEDLESDNSVVVLTHNPDTISKYPKDIVDLTIVGHTHCGQVRIPWLYESYRRSIMPTAGDFDCWLTQEDTTQLFITPWIGEVGLPIRFFNPPTLSVLDL